jgi:hypothetical protein
MGDGFLNQVAGNKQDKDKSLQDELLIKVLSELTNDKAIEMKTELNQRQINAVTKGLLFASEYNSPLMASLCKTQMKLMVSKARKGRIELTQMAQNINDHEDNKPSIRDKFF